MPNQTNFTVESKLLGSTITVKKNNDSGILQPIISSSAKVVTVMVGGPYDDDGLCLNSSEMDAHLLERPG